MTNNNNDKRKAKKKSHSFPHHSPISPSPSSSSKEEKDKIMLLIFVLAVVLPVSTSFWLLTSVFSSTSGDSSRDPGGVVDEESHASPTRWLVAVLGPILVSTWGLKRRSLDYSGAITGLFVGFVLTYSNYCFMSSLLCFFVTSSKATHFRDWEKRAWEEQHKEGGQRNWLQVLCNGGMAVEMALVYLVDRGCGERAIDFPADYRGSWTAIGVLAAIAASNGDTWASELATVLPGGQQPRLVTTWKKVPKGTNGGVSFAGLFFSAMGGLAVGVAFYCCLLLSLTYHALRTSAPQWPLVLVGAIAGLFGSLVDSLLGATLQFSGVEEKTGLVVERPGPGVRHVSGIALFDNHSVNLISSVLSALLVPKMAVVLWEVLL